ncbi:MAG: helix-turn-helix domain-containing protein [Alphaproteobacteria bacterium]|nr:helix-turn-helix domain-containing protein [Alphaproteobacteria bacterium]
MESKLPSLIDKLVGHRLRARRKELRLSQDKLAERLGVTFQQVQKYERGANRISAGRLYELARALETTIPYFYQGAPEVSTSVAGVAEEGEEFVSQIDTEAVDLMGAFHKIRDPELRKSILAMVKSQAAVFGDPEGSGSDD